MCHLPVCLCTGVQFSVCRVKAVRGTLCFLELCDIPHGRQKTIQQGREKSVREAEKRENGKGSEPRVECEFP